MNLETISNPKDVYNISVTINENNDQNDFREEKLKRSIVLSQNFS